MHPKPPRLAEWLLTKFLRDDIWKTPLGDFEEYFSYLARQEGTRKARVWYWMQVLQYVPSKIFHSIYWTAQMFKNYLKISLRNLRKNKGYSFINISGLAVGLATFVLIGLFVQHEFSYDTHFEDSDRIYRVVKKNQATSSRASNWSAVTPEPLHSTLKENFSQFEFTTYISRSNDLIKMGENSFYENGIMANGDLFDTFSYKWLVGDPKTALDNTDAIILTSSLAKKIFDNKNPVGETLEIIAEWTTETQVKTVTGVIEDIPNTTHLHFAYITNERSSFWHEGNVGDWDSNGYLTYVRLSGKAELDDKLLAKVQEYYATQMGRLGYYKGNPDRVATLAFVPLEDIHLKSSHLRHGGGTPGDIKYIYTLSLIGIIILLIACVNYMNLATARAVMRAKEVGVRKVIGALKYNLIMQFISEAVLLAFFSISFAALMVWVSLPTFGSLVNRTIGTELFMTPEFWLSMMGISLIVGIISGSYPALYMSSLKPSAIFKNHTKGGKANSFIRNALVTGQFAITTILIISSLVIFQQLQFVRTSDAGYSREQILTVSIKDENFSVHFDTISQIFKANPDILSTSFAQHLPTDIGDSTSGVDWEGREKDYRVNFFLNWVTYNYLEMIDVDLVAGRYFSPEFPTDVSKGYVINETAAASMGFTPEEAIGKRVSARRVGGTIVGVVKDFNFSSFQSETKPLLIMFNRPSDYKHLMLKIRPENLSETISFVETQVKQFSPDYPFEYAFLDDAFDTMYKTDLSLGKLFNAFTVLALFIASIGLFGLASFMMEQRAKEIGIRKVLGANLVQILTLVNKDFMRLIVISFIIAAPIGWYAMDTWLQDFAYRIELGPSIFIAAGFMAILVAILTVSYKSIKTALANPVNSLKSE